ncbi:NUDIX domain-containing protein [Rhizobium sp. BK181]|uniref:NUDIX domain-containing protein n=1 Tax=Rhizobium sp. BK181 TaxID=2587072 RepID=UPI001FEDFCBE|nr:NUDIX domain-containing protein [Rhizobium sp. BK181]
MADAGLKPSQAAEREAWEEAGIKGRSTRRFSGITLMRSFSRVARALPSRRRLSARG